jgi:hypothetical protein
MLAGRSLKLQWIAGFRVPDGLASSRGIDFRGDRISAAIGFPQRSDFRSDRFPQRSISAAIGIPRRSTSASIDFQGERRLQRAMIGSHDLSGV